ncbi:MAG: hypothetical protein JNM17_34915 [Archangium sp.]|nr:hypothetical protein [Archangium sp.]
MRVTLFALVVSASLGGCRPCPDEEPLTSTDGGAVSCVQNTDCPRPSSVLVCGNAEDMTRDCIACTSNRCVRYRPGTCP